MQMRMTNPAVVLPDAWKGIQNVFKGIYSSGIDARVVELVSLRASQINGCSACTLSHGQALAKLGEAQDKIASAPGEPRRMRKVSRSKQEKPPARGRTRRGCPR